MKGFKINYKTEVLTENTTVVPDGYCSIEFENIGDDGATLMNDIPLSPGNRARSFVNVPPDVIKEKMKLAFAGKSENRKVLVIKTYYQD
jgi:hypothetical protein